MNIKLTKSDFTITAIFLAVAVPVTFSGYDYSQGLARPILDTLVYTFFTLTLSFLIVFKLFPKYFPKKQIVLLFAIVVLLMMLFGVVEVLLYEVIEAGGLDKINWEKVIAELKKSNLWVYGIITSSENSGILIGILLGKKFYDAQMTIQEKEKEKKESELRLLKSQVDPHFLFNNLNTIDSLIDTNPDIAKTYLNKLAQLYRYLIRTKDYEVVTLEEELEFTNNYIYLMEQRFGAAYSFEIQKDPNLDDMLIPPAALQTLLENVVKHNQGYESNPIKTTIKITKKTITIQNNIDQKSKATDSYGIGLNNLKARYKFLSEDEIQIKSDHNFTVTLPVLNVIN